MLFETDAVDLQSFRLRAAYPIAKGSFAGSADGVECTTGALGIFVKNDQDNGNLILIVAWPVNLSFPIDIACNFDILPGDTLEAGDIATTVLSLTSDSAAGNPAALSVRVSIVGDPSPTPPVTTPTPSPTPACATGALTLTTLPGSDLDIGWTGFAHDQVANDITSFALRLDCAGSDCVVDGAALVGTNLGSPLPFSWAGVPVCLVNTFREAVSGTYDCASGCAEFIVKLTSTVFVGPDIAKPCPLCVADSTPDDGVRGGTCDSGAATPGASCDVGGVNSVFGPTSNDCVPPGSSVGQLAIDLNPLTTGTLTRTGAIDCGAPSFPGTCFCPNQDRPNDCSDGVCTVGAGGTGICEAGPVHSICSNQRFRPCTSGSGTQDCDDIFPGAGICEDVLRPCFGNTVSRTGACGTQTSTLVSISCVPPTIAPAVNVSAGLPGPAALSLPIVAVPRPSDGGEHVQCEEGQNAGICCTSDAEGDGPTPSDPVETAVCGSSGAVTIEERPVTLQPPNAFRFLTQQIDITAPPATPSEPLIIVFTLDASRVPAGETENTMEVFKDGTQVLSCIGASGTAVPDPCVESRALLPDGDIRITILTSTASAWNFGVRTTVPLDHFACYTTKAAADAPAFTKILGVAVADQFETKRFDLVKPLAVCNAASKNGEPLTDPDAHLTAYKLKQGKVCAGDGRACQKKQDCAPGDRCEAQEKTAMHAGVVVRNQLGTLVVDTGKPLSILLPSTQAPAGAPQPPAPENASGDPFKCYAVKPRPGVCAGDPTRACEGDTECGGAGPCFEDFPKNLRVRLEDDFTTPPKVFDVKKPTALCAPATVEGVAPHDAATHLQCYAIKAVKGQCTNAASTNVGASCKREEDCGGQRRVTSFCQPQPKHGKVLGLQARDAFRLLEVDTQKEAQLCVPSEKSLP